MSAMNQEKPEYIVSQSTHMCLSVLSGSEPKDAVVGLAKCSAKARQQWYIQEGRWEWGGNRSLCLAPDENNRKLCLVPCVSNKVCWALDSSHRLSYGGSFVADVPWQKPQTSIILYPQHNNINQKWWLFSDLQTHAITKPSVTELPHIYQQETPQYQPSKQEPEFLISQSTNTALTVVSGTNSSNAVVEMAKYIGSARQHWYPMDGVWRWGKDQSFCLAPNWKKHTLTLAPSDASAPTWLMDNGIMLCKSWALDVPWEKPRVKVIVYPHVHGGENQKWKNRSSLPVKEISSSSNNNCDTYNQEIAQSLVNKFCQPHETLPCQRNVSCFPGLVSSSAMRVSGYITLDVSDLSQRQNLRMTIPGNWQATDFYVPDGEAFQVILPKSLSHQKASQITVRVGAHCDHLQPSSDNLQRSTFKRMPDVTEEFDVEPGINDLRSQYGGNLIFTFDEGDKFIVDIEVKNVLKTLHFFFGKTSESEWDSCKGRDIPYCVFETNDVVLIVPSASACTITSPEHLLRRYDQVIHLLNDLAGFDLMDPPPRGKQWLVEDVQITAGSAHAGFPSMFCQDYYELCSLDTPYDWVTWHELGHNYQQSKWWSYAYGSESTVNLFSLYIQEKLTGRDRLKEDGKYLKTAKAVDEGLSFNDADCWQKLVFLMEIKHAFPDSGWNMYRTLNKNTRALSFKDADILASSVQNQFDYVYKVLSKAVGADLLPHYQRWGLLITQQAQNTIAQLGLQKSPRDLSLRSN